MNTYEKELHRLSRERELRHRLDKLSDRHFLLTILNEGNKLKMNTLVRDGKFPAYDIAQRIYDNNWTPTEKQRSAITNVYTFIHLRDTETRVKKIGRLARPPIPRPPHQVGTVSITHSRKKD